MPQDAKRFRVALSFPSEVRTFVESVAEHLATSEGRDRVLYDAWFEAELSRPEAHHYLQDLYRNQSELIVVFICSDYERKPWPRAEWRAIEGLIYTTERGRIMLLRVDDTPSGVLQFGDWAAPIEGRPALEIANLIRQRLTRSTGLASQQEPLIRENEQHGPGLSHGRMGSIHLHVDGAHAKEAVGWLMNHHEEKHYPAELTEISEFLPGPQRSDHRGIYDVHTPGVGKEELDFFSTTLLHDGPSMPGPQQWLGIQSVTRDALVYLSGADHDGVVVELERVIASINEFGELQTADPLVTPPSEVASVFASDALLFREDGRPLLYGDRQAFFEMHFCVDLPRRHGENRPIHPRDLIEMSREADLRVGGWFLFADSQRWAYRSNSFVVTRIDLDRLQREWQRLNAALRKDGRLGNMEVTVRLLVEECIAVWKTPLKKRADNILTVTELALWERSLPNLREFWVVAPNFLGDQERLVEEAMISNIDRGVNYVYFLHFHADAIRWLKFKERIFKRTRRQSGMEAYVVEFKDADRWGMQMSFIANPKEQSDRQAMRLRIDELTRRISSGSRMSENEISLIVGKLRPLVEADEVKQFQRVVDSDADTTLTAMLIVGRDMPPDAMARLDERLAGIASEHRGEISQHGRRRRLVVFSGFSGKFASVSRALRCAADVTGLAREQQYNVHIGIDFATAHQVMRSYGKEWEGEAITGCGDVLERSKADVGIFLSERAAIECKQEPWLDLEVERINANCHHVIQTRPGG